MTRREGVDTNPTKKSVRAGVFTIEWPFSDGDVAVLILE
jgi:hypothetical protein